MRFLPVVLAAGVAVFAVPATAYAQACTRTAAPSAQVAEGEYAIVSFFLKPDNNTNREVSTVHYGPGSTIPAALGATPFLSGVIVNPRACAATAPATPLAPAADPAKQFTVLFGCDPGRGTYTFPITAGPVVITSMPTAYNFVVEQGSKTYGIGSGWTGELRLPPGAKLKMACPGNNSLMGVVSGYRL